jgi:hypothetical protein
MVVKLLVDFFYESEYEPKLPIMAREQQAGVWTITVQRATAYTYDCPHTCLETCNYTQRRVCPHHACGRDCHFNCVKFACKICTTPQPPDAESSQLLIHSRMYEIGEKYDVPALKNLAREKFERACKKYWADAQFPIAASHSLSTTPDSDNGLRDVLCTTMIENHELFKNEAIKMLLIEYPRFTSAVVERLAAKVLQMTDR